MANTFIFISSVTVGSGGSSGITFSSIPSTYTDLLVKVSARSTRNTGAWTEIWFRINNNTSSVYTTRSIYEGGNSVTNNVLSSATYSQIAEANQANNTTGSVFSSTEIYLPSYRSSTSKPFSVEGTTEENTTDARNYLTAGITTDTNPITQLDIYPQTGFNWVQYTTAYLYGIKNS